MLLVVGVVVVLSGYLLGSVPSAYLIGRLGGIDLTAAGGDSRLGTSLTFRRLGPVSGLVVAIMDSGKGIVAIAVAQMVGVHTVFVLLAGLAAVTGHNWSVFLRFKGGRGAMTCYGILASLVLWQFLAALLLGGVLFFFTRRSTLATVIVLAILPVILWMQSLLPFPPALPWEEEITPLLMAFPPTMLVPIFLKGARTRRGRRAG